MSRRPSSFANPELPAGTGIAHGLPRASLPFAEALAIEHRPLGQRVDIIARQPQFDLLTFGVRGEG